MPRATALLALVRTVKDLCRRTRRCCEQTIGCGKATGAVVSGLSHSGAASVSGPVVRALISIIGSYELALVSLLAGYGARAGPIRETACRRLAVKCHERQDIQQEL
jgi:hypothetical protein